MIFSLACIYIFFFGVFIFFTRWVSVNGLSKHTLLFIWTLKACAGLFYIWAHKHLFHGTDIFSFYNDAQIANQLIQSDPLLYIRLIFGPNGGSVPPGLETTVQDMGFWWDTSAFMMVRFHSIASFFSFNNIVLHGVYSAALSFTGCLLIIQSIQVEQKLSTIGIILFFLTPSLLFWTSGPHKEALIVFGIGLLLFGLVRLLHGRNYMLPTLLIVAGTFVLLLTRDIVFYLLLPGIIGYMISKCIPSVSSLAIYAGIYVFVFMIAPLVYIPGYDQMNVLDLLVFKQEQFNALSGGKTSFHITNLTADYKSMLVHLPEALFNALIRPISLFKNGGMKLLTAIESMFLLVCFGFACRPILTHTKKTNIYYLLLTSSIVLLVIIGLVVPNLGAATRYKSIAILLLMPAFAISIKKR